MPKNDRAPVARDPVDRALCQVLEPDAASIDRVIRAARITRPAAPWAWRLVTASAAAAAVVWLAALAIPDRRAGSSLETPPEVPALLRISNEEGVVTVTTPAGSKMIILPGDP